MESPLKPQVRIPAGTQFGYQHGPPFHRTRTLLMESEEEVSAEAGFHLVVAPNGLGKTTLLRTLAGLHPALKGRPTTTGRVIYVSDELTMDPELSARALFRAWFRSEGLAAAHALADKLRLDVRRPIGQLSRGHRQKVLLVLAETLALESDSSLMLLDEPLSGLDAETREFMVSCWTASASSSVLRLVVMHELNVVEHAQSLITITAGRLRQTRDEGAQSWVEAYHRLQQT